MSETSLCPQCNQPSAPGVLGGLCPACLLKQGAATDSGVAGHPGNTAPPLDEIARMFPQLEILSLLGCGGMGAVYKARQPALDRFIALKILVNASNNSAFHDRFAREAQALARLNHPSIVAIYDFGQVDGLSFFIMEYIDGLNLRQLQRAGRLSPRETLQIVPQICDALQYAHDQGIVHRDIKPENILVDRKGRVKIADFGIAKLLGVAAEAAPLTGEGHVLGTPLYMAPEQIEHPTEVDHRADIYSLGVVFYEMLTGELPLGVFRPPSARSTSVRLDVRLDDVVLRALEKQPELRYQHASEFKTRVDQVSSTEPPESNPTPPAAAASRQTDSVYYWILGGAVSAALMVVSMLVVPTLVTRTRAPAVATIMAGLAFLFPLATALCGFNAIKAANALGMSNLIRALAFLECLVFPFVLLCVCIAALLAVAIDQAHSLPMFFLAIIAILALFFAAGWLLRFLSRQGANAATKRFPRPFLLLLLVTSLPIALGFIGMLLPTFLQKEQARRHSATLEPSAPAPQPQPQSPAHAE